MRSMSRPSRCRRSAGSGHRSTHCEGGRCPGHAASSESRRKDEGRRNASRFSIADGDRFACCLSADARSAATWKGNARNKANDERGRRARAIAFSECLGSSWSDSRRDDCRTSGESRGRTTKCRPRGLCFAGLRRLPRARRRRNTFRSLAHRSWKEVPGYCAAYIAAQPHQQDARRRNAGCKSQRRADGTTGGISVQLGSWVCRPAKCTRQGPRERGRGKRRYGGDEREPNRTRPCSCGRSSQSTGLAWPEGLPA